MLSGGPGQWLDRAERVPLLTLKFFQIEILLESKPELRSCAKELCQTKSCVRRNNATPSTDLNDSRQRNVNRLGESVLANTHRLEKFLQKDFAGVNVSQSF